MGVFPVFGIPESKVGVKTMMQSPTSAASPSKDLSPFARANIWMVGTARAQTLS
jgi:hypothetical protein